MKTALTIGFFDGVHIGHQVLLKRLRQCPHATILTFSNHPQSVLCPPAPSLILSFEERISLLKPYADELVILPFTQELANTTFTEILDRFTLSHLILGEHSAFGKNREGNEANVQKYGEQKKIIVEYIPKVFWQNEPVSSSRIRNAIGKNDHDLAKQLLGRKYE